MMSDLVERLQEALEECGKSARAASIEAGLGARFVSDLLDQSKVSLSVRNAEKLARVVNRTPEYLAFGVGPKRPGEKSEAEIISLLDRIPARNRDMAKRILRSMAEDGDE